MALRPFDVVVKDSLLLHNVVFAIADLLGKEWSLTTICYLDYTLQSHLIA